MSLILIRCLICNLCVLFSFLFFFTFNPFHSSAWGSRGDYCTSQICARFFPKQKLFRVAVYEFLVTKDTICFSGYPKTTELLCTILYFSLKYERSSVGLRVNYWPECAAAYSSHPLKIPLIPSSMWAVLFFFFSFWVITMNNKATVDLKIKIQKHSYRKSGWRTVSASMLLLSSEQCFSISWPSSIGQTLPPLEQKYAMSCTNHGCSAPASLGRSLT